MPDGAWSDATALALRDYQIMQNMPPTGRLNLATLHKLMGDAFPAPGPGKNRGQQPMEQGPMNSDSGGHNMMNDHNPQ